MMSLKDIIPHIRVLPLFLLSGFAAFSLLTSCSSDKVIEQIEEKEETGDPMRFTCNVQETSAATRAPYLQSDFVVSTYKSFKQTGQQTVMDSYHVEHYTSGSDWYGNITSNWNYVGVDGQIERYWDYGSFPYRFNAIAPYKLADKSKLTLTDNSLVINAPYKMQTWRDGVKDNADDRVAEPFWVAQVQRAPDGKDMDIMTGKEIPNASSTSLNRYVALPFHHLNSKVRFALYTTSHWATAHPIYVRNLSIKVVSENFVTGAAGYAATGDSWYKGTGNSGFTGLTKAPATGTELIHYTGVGSDNKPLQGNDLSQWQTKQTAFWFDCKDGLMQIPQEGVQMKVSMDLYLVDGDDLLDVPLHDIPVKVSLDGSEPTDLNNWQSGNIYTYYLIIDNVGEKLEIHFTATLTPWEDISGSLSTDLEQ